MLPWEHILARIYRYQNNHKSAIDHLTFSCCYFLFCEQTSWHFWQVFSVMSTVATKTFFASYCCYDNGIFKSTLMNFKYNYEFYNSNIHQFNLIVTWIHFKPPLSYLKCWMNICAALLQFSSSHWDRLTIKYWMVNVTLWHVSVYGLCCIIGTIWLKALNMSICKQITICGTYSSISIQLNLIS